jgi:hypothetical protein
MFGRPRLTHPLIALVTALVWAITATPAAAAGWHVETTPPPVGVSEPELTAVSCASASLCLAVGDGTGGSGTYKDFGDRWNGSVWRATTLGAGSEAPAVSCANASFCMALGGSGPLAYRRHGTVWTRTPAPLPASSRPTDLSCVSATLCTVVGSSGSRPFAAEWNGRNWRTERPPSQGDRASLNVVSCPAANACFAAGDYDIRTSSVTFNEYLLFERWNGRSWVNQRVADYRRLANYPASLSCATRSSCLLVGADTPQGNGLPEAFAESWNGRHWETALAGLPLPHSYMPGTKQYAQLSSVSCWAVAACLAVGSTLRPGGNPKGLAMLWNGHRWKADPDAVPRGRPALSSAACVRGGICTIVGSRNDSTLAEQNGPSSKSLFR